jgi:XTP/dITP diphosphohydrolase
LKGAKRIVYFATTNRDKYAEAAGIARPFGIRLKRLNFEKYEIQSDNLVEIAAVASRHAAKTKKLNVVTEDAGFFVDSLGGFPGAYSSYVYKTLGVDGILRLMRSARDRKAWFSAAVAYCEPMHYPVCFTGTVTGVVGRRAKGAHGFGFDPIFIPNEGDGRTFAEMAVREKNALSHRARAFKKFADWYTSE